MTDKKDTSNKNEKIDTLKKEVSDIGKLLEDLSNELKNNDKLSEEEKKVKVDTIKTQAETVKKKIEAKISALSDKTDDDSVKEKEEAEILLTSLNDTIALQASILNTGSTSKIETPTETTDDEKKGFFKKTGEWISDKRSNIPKGGKAAIGVIGTAIAGTWLYKKCKKRFGKDEKKESESKDSSKSKEEKKKPWWKRFLTGTAIAAGTVIGGVEIYKNWNRITSWVKEKLGLALSFEEAMFAVEAEVRNGMIKDDNFGSFCAHFEGISYDENTQEISSFGQKTKINKSKKTIEGMDDVQFRSREELFHAVNIINFAKKELRGRGKTNTPFSINQVTGDIDFELSESGKREFMNANGSNFWTRMLGLGGAGGGGILGGYFLGLKGGLTGAVGGGLAGYTIGSLIDNTSTMGRACGTIAKGANLQKFKNYLNRQNIRGEQQEVYEADDKTPIHSYLNEVKKEINESYGDEESGVRNLHVEWDENTPSEYKIISYGQEVTLKLEGCDAKKGEQIDFSKITKISLGNYTKKLNSENEESRGNGLNIDFPHDDKGLGLKEAIRVANLTNKIRNDWSRRGAETYPFAYGKYKSPFALEIDVPGLGSDHLGGTTILNNDTLREKYPTLYKDLQKFPSTQSAVVGAIASRRFQEKMHDQARHDKQEGSQYIKYLHQMGQGNKRKK